MARTENATAADFKKLAKGKGGYDLKQPGAPASTSRPTSRAR